MDKYARMIVYAAIMDLKGKGADNSIFQNELCDYLQIAPMVLKREIKAEREAGAPICSGINGYFIATEPEDVRQQMHSIKSYIRSQFQTLAALGRIYKKFGSDGD